MEYQKIINLLGNIPDQVPRFVTKKWVEIYDKSGRTCNANKESRFKTPMLRSDLYDYNDAYILLLQVKLLLLIQIMMHMIKN